MIKKLAATGILLFWFCAVALAGFHGGGGGGSPLKVALSQRSAFSLNYVYNSSEYAFINAFAYSNAMWSPSGSGWSTSSQSYNASITDAQGNITYSYLSASGLQLGSSIVFPNNAEFAGPWCLDSSDTTHAQSFTMTFQSNEWVQAANTTCANGACTGSGTSLTGNVLTVSGTNWCIPLTYTGSTNQDHWNITQNDPSAVGAYARNMRLYQQPDTTDLQNGLIFRRPFKQVIVNEDPSFIRMVNWNAPNDQSSGLAVRFENRPQPIFPGQPNYSGYNLCTGTAPYNSNIAGQDAYTLSAATATGCSPLNTPASLQHGEVVIARIANANSQGGCFQGICPIIQGITNAANAVITTSEPTNLSIGQSVILYISNSGLTNLDEYPVTVASIGSPTTASFTGQINTTCGGSGSGTQLDITAVSAGTIQIGMTLTGSTIASGGTVITGFVSGTMGSTGCYTVNNSENSASTSMTGALAAATSVAQFTGQIAATCGGTGSGTALDVTAVASGTIQIGMGIIGGTSGFGIVITGFVSGSMGGVGCYTVSSSHSYASAALFGYISSSVSLNYDSTSSGSFDLATCGTGVNSGCYISPYITFNLNGLGAAPVATNGGAAPITWYNTTSFPANSYVTLVYDKLLYAHTDGSGNPIYGVWHFWGGSGSGGYGGLNWPVPIEIEVELINELNAMLPAGRPPINLWYNMPRMAMVSTDPDYSTASAWDIQAVNVILNGANGYAGLCAKCGVMLELSDEDWNFGYAGSDWMVAVGAQRWAGVGLGGNDFSSYSTLRSLWLMNDVKNSAYYNQNRVWFDRGGQQVGGTTGAPNGVRIYGNYTIFQDAQFPLTETTFAGSVSGTTLTAAGTNLSLYENVTDSAGHLSKPALITAILGGGQYTLNTSQGTIGSETMIAAQAPMTLWDIFTGAPYFQPSSTVINTDITQCSNDAATYGIPSSQVTADVAQIADDTAVGSGSQTISSAETQDAALAAEISVFGANKYKGDYGEGGLNLNPGAYTGTCPNCATWSESCINLVYQSQEWANQQKAYFESFAGTPNLAVPAAYLLDNSGWQWANGYSPDSFALVGGVETEGAGVTLNWLAQSAYNASLSK